MFIEQCCSNFTLLSLDSQCYSINCNVSGRRIGFFFSRSAALQSLYTLERACRRTVLTEESLKRLARCVHFPPDRDWLPIPFVEDKNRQFAMLLKRDYE